MVSRSIRPHLTAALVTQQKRGSQHFQKAGFGMCKNQKRNLRSVFKTAVSVATPASHERTAKPHQYTYGSRGSGTEVATPSTPHSRYQLLRCSAWSPATRWTDSTALLDSGRLVPTSLPCYFKRYCSWKVPWTLNQNIAGQKTWWRTRRKKKSRRGNFFCCRFCCASYHFDGSWRLVGFKNKGVFQLVGSFIIL